MNKRKLVLSVVDIILAVILICQIAFKKKETVQIFTIEDEITKIEITTPAEDISINKFNALWQVNDEKYTADKGIVDSMIELLKSFRVIDTVAKTDNDAELSKYDLQNGKAVVIKVYNGDKLLRTIHVGKNTPSLYQTYIKVDNSKEVYLANADFIEDFDTSIDRVRSNVIWAVDGFDISMVKQTNADGVLTVTYANDAWAVGGADIDLNATEAQNWANAFATVTANHWLADNAELPGEQLFRIDLTCNGKDMWLVVNTAFDEASNMELYYGRASESPYPFELSSYFVNRLQRTPDKLSN